MFTTFALKYHGHSAHQGLPHGQRARQVGGGRGVYYSQLGWTRGCPRLYGTAGRLVLEKLRQHPKFEVVGLVRRPEQAAELGPPGLILGDITKPETYEEALRQCDKLVM